ncbi:MAG: hypothetical protein GOV15_03130, partial [Candidatus Diapherotrites archaeon]|nr:hypothetical protein [Candidatus Diapherotrites archaeon]
DNAIATTPNGWTKHLYFGPYNEDHNLASISLGGTIADHFRWKFIAKDEGTLNRAFTDVTADGSVYCYDDGYDRGAEGKLILRMNSDTEVEVAFESGKCKSTESLVDGTIYER